MTLPPRRNAPHIQGMRNERDTLPPSHEERQAVWAFEQEAQTQGDFWAYVRRVAQLAGLVK